MESSENPLIVVTKDAESTVQLHPLVILSITDLITRRTVRSQTGPIIGAILGSQDGRTITMEAAFECKVLDEQEDSPVQLDMSFFADRLQQYRDVYKTLDLVGWFTLAPTSGPQADHLPVHRQLAEAYNESILFLAFHPSEIVQDTSKGDKLPVSVYEPIVEAGTEDADKPMQASGEATTSTSLRFKELPYKIESGDAEMIGVDFVARGGANAAAVQSTPTQNGTKTPASADVNKGKGKAKVEEAETISDLTPEEEDLIASMTAKVNAIRMLRQRVSLLKKYLESLPPCYLNDPSITACEPHDRISHPILRAIAALLARLPLLIPYTPASKTPTSSEPKIDARSAFEQESTEQATDVALISLLGTLGSTLQDAQAMGEKSSIVERASQHGVRRDLIDAGYGGFGDSGVYGSDSPSIMGVGS